MYGFAWSPSLRLRSGRERVLGRFARHVLETELELLRILEEKGHLVHKARGREFVYGPTRPRKREGRSALRRVLTTFFDGSLSKAVTAHMTDPAAQFSPEDLMRLEQLIKEARKREEDRQ